MKYVIIDDDKNICKILRQIINEKQLGSVEDYFTDPEEALEDLPLLKPDFVLVDLLMPEMDGITFVSKAKEKLPLPFFYSPSIRCASAARAVA